VTAITAFVTAPFVTAITAFVTAPFVTAITSFVTAPFVTAITSFVTPPVVTALVTHPVVTTMTDPVPVGCDCDDYSSSRSMWETTLARKIATPDWVRTLRQPSATHPPF